MPNSNASSFEVRVFVGAGWQMIREMIPGPKQSDEAANLMLEKLREIALEIGEAAFQETVQKVIDTCEHRPTVATFRRLAGLSRGNRDPYAEALAAAWRLIAHTVRRHVTQNAHGKAELQSVVRVEGTVARWIAPPELPESVKTVVNAMGGWGALQESYPAWWGQRWQQFKELVTLSPEDVRMLLTPATPSPTALSRSPTPVADSADIRKA